MKLMRVRATLKNFVLIPILTMPACKTNDSQSSVSSAAFAPSPAPAAETLILTIEDDEAAEFLAMMIKAGLTGDQADANSYQADNIECLSSELAGYPKCHLTQQGVVHELTGDAAKKMYTTLHSSGLHVRFITDQEGPAIWRLAVTTSRCQRTQGAQVGSKVSCELDATSWEGPLGDQRSALGNYRLSCSPYPQNSQTTNSSPTIQVSGTFTIKNAVQMSGVVTILEKDANDQIVIDLRDRKIQGGWSTISGRGDNGSNFSFEARMARRVDDIVSDIKFKGDPDWLSSFMFQNSKRNLQCTFVRIE